MVPRELQQGLDQLKKEFEDLKRDHELGLKRKAECEANNGRCITEVATLRKTLEVLLQALFCALRHDLCTGFRDAGKLNFLLEF